MEKHRGGKKRWYWKPFSELFVNPTHPLLIHMVPPFVDENCRMFHLQVSGEVLCKWSDVCRLETLFEKLQVSIMPLGYQLQDSTMQIRRCVDK